MRRLLLAMSLVLVHAQIGFSQPAPLPASGGAKRGPLTDSAQYRPNHFLRVNGATGRIATNFVVAEVHVGGGIPTEIAVIVRPARPADNARLSSPQPPILPHMSLAQITNVYLEWARTNRPAPFPRPRATDTLGLDWTKAAWKPFTAQLPIDLGPGDGEREVWVAVKWKEPLPGTPNAPDISETGTRVIVDHAPPMIVITKPKEQLTSQPMIQLAGYTEKPLRRIRYDVINASRRVEDREGYSTHLDFDPASRGPRTNYFECLDIELALGTNTVVVRCEDEAGNTATTTLHYVLSFEHDKTPPVISLAYPTDGMWVYGDTFTARGTMDDPTARIMCEISADEKTNIVNGLVERDGKFWLEQTPLPGERNLLVITAADAAGNVSSTNLTVYKSHDLLIIDPVPAAQLNNHTVTVTGKISPPDSDIWVNDVKGTVHPDGTWVVYKVPPGEGGTAVLQAHAARRTPGPAAVSPVRKPESPQNPGELVFVQTTLGTNGLTLNAQQPSCGAFKLHLTGTAGRSFVLLASTNLVEWTPLSTNSSLGPSFDYADTTTTNYPCRFYRVLPIP